MIYTHSTDLILCLALGLSFSLLLRQRLLDFHLLYLQLERTLPILLTITIQQLPHSLLRTTHFVPRLSRLLIKSRQSNFPSLSAFSQLPRITLLLSFPSLQQTDTRPILTRKRRKLNIQSLLLLLKLLNLSLNTRYLVIQLLTTTQHIVLRQTYTTHSLQLTTRTRVLQR